MATNDQVKQLAKAYMDANDDAFRTALLQIGASEAKKGHASAAREMKELADRIKGRPRGRILNLSLVDGLFQVYHPKIRFDELIVSDAVKDKLRRIVDEYRNRGKLALYGYANRRRILLEGAPGTGKTMTASVVASELGMTLYVVQMDKLITKYMGETSVKLRQIFDTIQRNVGVYLFDEFDAIGADRGLDNEVGEMRRILNSFLQFIEADSSESIIVAATNNKQMLDRALFRRFDDVLHYGLPTVEEAGLIAESVIGGYDTSFFASDDLSKRLANLCQAEIVGVCRDAIKDALLSGEPVTNEGVLALCNERLDIYCSSNAEKLVG